MRKNIFLQNETTIDIFLLKNFLKMYFTYLVREYYVIETQTKKIQHIKICFFIIIYYEVPEIKT